MRKEQINFSEDLSSLKKDFFQFLIVLYTSKDSNLSELLASRRGVYFPQLVLEPKLQPGAQMDLNSSELPDEINAIVKGDTVTKLMYYKKTANVPPKYFLEMHDIKDRDFTRYETL